MTGAIKEGERERYLLLLLRGICSTMEFTWVREYVIECCAQARSALQGVVRGDFSWSCCCSFRASERWALVICLKPVVCER